jgi:hypothetical protein
MRTESVYYKVLKNYPNLSWVIKVFLGSISKHIADIFSEFANSIFFFINSIAVSL